MRAVTTWCVAATLLAAVACTPTASAPAADAPPPAAAPAPVGTTGSPARHVSVDFQNVDFHVASGVVMQVRRLQGALLATHHEAPPSFDDLASYALQVEAGEIAMTPASLSALLNTQVFAYDGAPISNVEISIEDGRLVQKGTLHKGLDVPFTIVAAVSVTRDGRIRLHPESVRTIGIPAGGLMKLFGLELDDLIKSNQSRGFEIVEDDFLLTPDRLLSQPRVVGHLTAIRVEPTRIVEIFGSRPAAGSDGVAKNYMYYRGGDLRFGKLTMHDADLRLVDADPRDPFDFSPAQYAKQLTAGYSKSLANGGLRTFMPDLGEPLPR
jgi:hypothetical protein